MSHGENQSEGNISAGCETLQLDVWHHLLGTKPKLLWLAMCENVNAMAYEAILLCFSTKLTVESRQHGNGCVPGLA